MLVSQYHYRNLEFIGDIKSLCGQRESLLNRSRSIYHTGKLAMTGMDDKIKVSLLSAGGKTSCRRRPLGVNHDYRSLGHGGKTYAFSHKGKTSP